MPSRFEIASNLGAFVTYVKYSFTPSDLTTAGLTQTVQLPADPGGNPFQTPATSNASLNSANFQVYQGGIILYVRIKQSIQFAAPAASSLTLTLQKTGGTNFTTPGTIVSGNLMNAVADTTLTEFSGFAMSQHSSTGLAALFTAVAGNVNTFTAGQVDLYILYTNISTSANNAQFPGNGV